MRQLKIHPELEHDKSFITSGPDKVLSGPLLMAFCIVLLNLLHAKTGPGSAVSNLSD